MGEREVGGRKANMLPTYLQGQISFRRPGGQLSDGPLAFPYSHARVEIVDSSLAVSVPVHITY